MLIFVDKTLSVTHGKHKGNKCSNLLSNFSSAANAELKSSGTFSPAME